MFVTFLSSIDNLVEWLTQIMLILDILLDVNLLPSNLLALKILTEPETGGERIAGVVAVVIVTITAGILLFKFFFPGK